jgi:hypothetical protein
VFQNDVFKKKIPVRNSQVNKDEFRIFYKGRFSELHKLGPKEEIMWKNITSYTSSYGGQRTI